MNKIFIKAVPVGTIISFREMPAEDVRAVFGDNPKLRFFYDDNELEEMLQDGSMDENDVKEHRLNGELMEIKEYDSDPSICELHTTDGTFYIVSIGVDGHSEMFTVKAWGYQL